MTEAWPACLLAWFFERPRHEESEGSSAGKQNESSITPMHSILAHLPAKAPVPPRHEFC